MNRPWRSWLESSTKFAEGHSAAGLGVAVTIALHAAVAAALLTYEPARTSLAAAAPIMVDWIAPPAPATPPEPEPHVRPPKPRPVVKRPVIPPPPAPLVTSAAPPVEPAVAPAPAAPTPVPAEEPARSPAPTIAAVEVTPPLFNADYLKNPEPPYPAQSRRLGEEGRVILRVLVGAAGAAEEVQIRASSGYPRLDEAARQTVRQWKFQPARRGSEAVPAWVLVPIRFSLES